tara:strand:- start:448 stop:558 length:111 start_codon:yes stop_codon:yes gene_type:complete
MRNKEQEKETALVASFMGLILMFIVMLVLTIINEII